MKLKRFFLSLLLIFSMVFAMAFPANADGDVNTIIRNLLNYYRYYESDAWTDVERLLKELEELDPAEADNWRKVMESWDYAVNHLDITLGCLPDGLPEDDSLCIVVMGYALKPDGSMKDELVGRCQVALNSYKKYPNALIICSGGGTASKNSHATEAGRMADWLIANGVDESRIVIENRSLSSEHNAMYSMKILKEQYPNVDTLALISSDYHLRRCYVLFQAALALNDWDGDYTVAANAGFDAAHVGEEGPKIEAESIGLIRKLYVSGMSKPTLSIVESIMVQGDNAYLTGEALDLSVTAYYNTDVSRDVTEDVVFSGYDLSQPGQQEVTVTYTENDRTVTTTMQITVAAAPVETSAPPTLPPETQATETEPATPAMADTAEEDRPSLLILLIPLALAVVLMLVVIHMVQKQRRRRRRRRKKMQWD